MNAREQIVPIILAAGSSKHLGFPKALARFDGKTALDLAIENCAGIGPTVVVVGCDSRRVRAHAPPGTRVVMNKHWRKGQLSSILCAMRRIPGDAAILLYPVDHPLLKTKTIQQLVRAFRTRNATQEIVMPCHKKRYGHPVILSAALRKELFRAGTAREVVYRDLERIKPCQMRTSAIYEDFATPKSYRRCLRNYRAHRASWG
jgi:molybdenum cofactor cytidylyltransferase